MLEPAEQPCWVPRTFFLEAHGQCGPEVLEWSVLAPAKISAPNSKTAYGGTWHADPNFNQA